MSTRARITALGAGLIAGTLFASPALAQVTAPAPTAAQITTFSRNVGVNETCTRAFLAANNGAFPQGLTDLNQFAILAPAADLCTPAAVASAVNNTPPPTDIQIAAYGQTVGVNNACIKAFVLHDNSLPTSLSELNEFRQAAPAQDLCTQAAIAKASS